MPKDTDFASDSGVRAVEMRRRRRHPILTTILSPAYDLLLSIHVAFSNPNERDFDIDPQWLERVHALCPPETRSDLAFFFGNDTGQWCASSLFGLLWQSPTPADTQATIAWLRTVPPDNLLPVVMESHGLGDDWRETAQEIIRAQLGNKHSKKNDLAQRIQTFAKRFPNVERAAVAQFLTDPSGECERLINAIAVWYTQVYVHEEPRIVAALSRESARLDRKRHDAQPEEIFTMTIRGIEYDPPANIERVVLAPSLMIMPTIFHQTVDDTLTYCYPITDVERTPADVEANQRREMVRIFDALADDTRIRILRLLANRQMYLTELAENLKLTKATTRHHMVRLRAAGLVTLHMRDHLSYYSLRRETLEEPTRVLLAYLGLSPS